MFLDWLTLKICASKIPPTVLNLLRADASTILCITPDGDVEWETISRVNIKSDSHQLNISVGGYVVVTGSPARFMPDEFGIHDNVFGSLDIVECANLMLGHIEKTIGLKLPEYKKWDCTRVDVTQNYFIKNGAHGVEKVLSYLRTVEMGKYRTATYADSVYWQKGNRISSGKAYYKGAQLLKDFRKRIPAIMEHITKDFCFDEVMCQLALDKICDDKSLNDFEILEKTKHIHDTWSKADEASKRLKMASSILRLEATFGSRYWNEKNKKTGLYLYRLKPWYNYTKQDLIKMFDGYFDTRIGKGVPVKDIDNIIELFEKSALDLGFSASLGRSAYKTVTMIKGLGKFQVYSKHNPNPLIPKSTFYKHRKVALNAGFTLADFEGGVVVPFQRNTIEFEAVNGWDQLHLLVG